MFLLTTLNLPIVRIQSLISRMPSPRAGAALLYMFLIIKLNRHAELSLICNNVDERNNVALFTGWGGDRTFCQELGYQIGKIGTLSDRAYQILNIKVAEWPCVALGDTLPPMDQTNFSAAKNIPNSKKSSLNSIS